MNIVEAPKKPVPEDIAKLRSELNGLPTAEMARRMQAVLAKVRDTNMTDAECRHFVVKTLSGED